VNDKLAPTSRAEETSRGEEEKEQIMHTNDSRRSRSFMIVERATRSKELHSEMMKHWWDGEEVLLLDMLTAFRLLSQS
jgi:hypothetical protein